MFWDRVAGIYDLFVNIYNRKTHQELCRQVADLIHPTDSVLECACGTGMLTEVIAPRCASLTATDFSLKMLEKTKKKCAAYSNITFKQADILHLDEPDEAFDVVLAANVIHLVDEPYQALAELDRVCKPGGRLVIPTYMNREKGGNDSAFSKTVGKAGADFKRQFTFSSYQEFFKAAGYTRAQYTFIEGRVPCALAVLRK